MPGETGEVSSIGVKLTLEAGEFMGGMKAAQGSLNTFQEQAARAGSGAGQLKAGGGKQLASGPSSAQNLSGVNVSLSLNKGQLAELRTEITKGLGAIPVTISPQFAKAGPQSIQSIMGAMLSMQYGGSPAQGRIAAKQAIEHYVPQLPHRASGGPVQQGRPVVVGEHRAEVFRPGATGWIEKDIREYRRRAAELAALEFQISQSQRRLAGGPVEGPLARRLREGAYQAPRPIQPSLPVIEQQPFEPEWMRRAREKKLPPRVEYRMAGGPVSRSFRVADPMGLHARPSGMLAQIAKRYPEATIQLRNLTSGVAPHEQHGFGDMDARSMWGWLMLGAKTGDEVGMMGQGERAELALHQLARAGSSPKMTGLAKRRLKTRWQLLQAGHAWRGATALAYQQTMNPDIGGGTFPLVGGPQPSSGYAVGIATGTSHLVPAGDPRAFLEAYRAQKRAQREAGGFPPYVGTWLNKGQIHIDPAAVFDRRRDADLVARAKEQLAFFDLKRFVEIPTSTHKLRATAERVNELIMSGRKRQGGGPVNPFGATGKLSGLLHRTSEPIWGNLQLTSEVSRDIDQIRGMTREHWLGIDELVLGQPRTIGQAVGSKTGVSPGDSKMRPGLPPEMARRWRSGYGRNYGSSLVDLEGLVGIHNHPYFKGSRDVWRPSIPDIVTMFQARERESWVVTPQSTNIMRPHALSSGRDPGSFPLARSMAEELAQAMGIREEEYIRGGPTPRGYGHHGFFKPKFIKDFESPEVLQSFELQRRMLDRAASEYGFDWELWKHPFSAAVDPFIKPSQLTLGMMAGGSVRSRRGYGITRSHGNIKGWENAQWRDQERREIEDRITAARAESVKRRIPGFAQNAWSDFSLPAEPLEPLTGETGKLWGDEKRAGGPVHAKKGAVVGRMTPEEMDFAGNLRAAAARISPNQMKFGKAWYADAQNWINEQSVRYGIEPTTVRGVTAALSAGTSWQANKAKAHRVLQTHRMGLFGESFPYSMKLDAHGKARAILEGADPEGILGHTPKVGAFYRNLGGDLDAVTLDRWAFRTATRGHLSAYGEGPLRNDIDAAYRQVAGELGLHPSELQAAAWLYEKETNPLPNRKGKPQSIGQLEDMFSPMRHRASGGVAGQPHGLVHPGGNFASQVFQTAADWANDPFMAIMSWQSLQQKQQRMAGGPVRKMFTVADELGLHMRPAAHLARMAADYDAFITIQNLTRDMPQKGVANAQYMHHWLALAARQGNQLRISATGVDAEVAVRALGALIQSPGLTRVATVNRSLEKVDPDRLRAAEIFGKFSGRAGGGSGSGNGLYIVGEIGKELFVPNRLAHLVPKHVMDQIPRAANGGIVEIGRKRNELFAPPEDGIIIPNRLIDQIPHAAEGLRGRGIDVGAAFERGQVSYGGGTGEAQSLLRTMAGPINVAQATIANTGAINAPQATVAATAPQKGAGRSTWAPGEEDAVRASLKEGAGTTKGGKFQFEAAGSDWAALDAAAKGQGGAGPENPIDAMRAEAKAEYREEKRYGEQPPSRMEERLEELQVSRAGLSSTMRGSSPKMAIAQISSWLLGGRQEFTQAGAGVTVAANAFRRVNRETSSEIGELTKFIDKLGAATGGSAEEEADRTKAIEKATANRAVLEKRQNDAVEDLDRANQKALPTNAGVLKNLGVIIGATSLYGMAMQAASTVLTEAAIPAVGKLIDEFTGWGSTFTKTTMALGDQARQMGGNVDVAIAATGAQAGLSAETAKWMSSVLQASTVAKAGSENFAVVSDLFKASFGASGRETQGLYGAYGGIGGTSLFAEQIGGSQGYLQRVAGTAKAARGSENIVADVMDVVGTTLPMLVGGLFGAQSGWNMLGDQTKKIRGTDPEKLGRIADDMQAGMVRVSKKTGEAAYTFGLLTDAEKARLQSVKNLPAEAADLAKYGLGFRDAAGNLITDLKELDKAVLQSAKGYTIPDPQEWIGIMSQQIKGQFDTLDIKSEINRTLIIPLEYATSRIAEPLTPPGAGLIPGALQVGRVAGAMPGFVGRAMYQGLGASERGAGWLADAARMQRELKDQNDQALADARARIVEMYTIPGTTPSTTGAPGVPVSGAPIVNPNTGFVTGVAGSPVVNPSTGFVTGMAGTTPSTQGPQIALWDKYIAQAKGYSAEIQSINNQIGTMSAILNQTQWANASRLAHRALADARDYWKGVDSQGGKSLGAVQKRLWDIGRAQTSLGLQLQQRAITTNLAVAQFQAPGETGEERYFRQKEAIQKAGIEQQQLDLGVEAFKAQGKEWSIVAQRNIKDLSIQADLTEQQIALDKDRLAAEGKIAALTDKMGIALKNASDIFGTAESKFETGLGAASKYVETFGGTIKDALVEIWKGLGYTVTEGRNGSVNVSGSSGSGDTSQSGAYFGYSSTPTSRKPAGENWVWDGYKWVKSNARAMGYLGSFGKGALMTVGEAGPETVAILRNPRAASMGDYMGGGGGPSNVTVNINGPVVRGDADISILARQVAVEVERTLSRKGQMFGLRGPAV